MLLEELATATTAVHAQHAKSISDDDATNRTRLEHVEEAARLPVIIYDTDWHDGIVKTILPTDPPRVENARDKYPVTIHFDQARVHQPQSVLLREQHEHLERSNEEMAQPIDEEHTPSDRSIEQIEESHELAVTRGVHQAIINDQQTNDGTLELADLYEDPLPLERSIESISESVDHQHHRRTQSPELVLCQPIGHHLDNLQEQTGPLTDDSLLIRHQQFLTSKPDETNVLENSLRSTATLTLNYPHQNQNINPPWQRVFDEQVSDQHHHQEQLHLQTAHVSPRFLATISPPAEERALNRSENYASEFRQTPLLHENVRVDHSSSLPLLPSAHIQQTQPVYRVRAQQISSTDDPEYASISSLHAESLDLMHANTRPIEPVSMQPPSIPIDIEIRIRPTYSETSSLLDMESFLNRFEDSLEPEQHLPLVDQISLSYTTTLRSVQDDTQSAIERYEAEHPFFSRSLPLTWVQPSVLPHDEQLMEQWIVEQNLDTIQQQVELSTNTECASAIAIATDACCSIGERFEEEEKSTSPETNDRQNNLVASAVFVSHCSPTSDYETDSLDKDNETTSTTASIEGDAVALTTPSTATTTPFDAVLTVPMDCLFETLTIDPPENYHQAKDLLLSMGLGQELHCAYENELEHHDHPLMFSSHHERELLNIFFEPAPFNLPVVNEISIYQISFPRDYPICTPSNSLLPLDHVDESLSLHQYQADGQHILSIGQIHEPSDNEEQLESISPAFESPSSIEHLQIQSPFPLSETFFAQIHSPPTIMEHVEEKRAAIDYTTDDQSSDSILPDVIPTEVQIEVIHACTEYRRTARDGGVYLHVQSLQSTKLNPSVVESL